MRGGSLRSRITIQIWEENPGTTGEPIATWSDFTTVWGSLIPFGGSEKFDNHQVAGEMFYKIRVRYSAKMAQVTEKDRAVFKSRIFDIISILNNGERNKEMTLVCKERL